MTCAVTMCVILPLLATMVIGYVPAGALVFPEMVRVEVPAAPPESATVAGLNEELIPLTLWMPSSSKLSVPVKSSGVAVKVKVA